MGGTLEPWSGGIHGPDTGALQRGRVAAVPCRFLDRAG